MSTHTTNEAERGHAENDAETNVHSRVKQMGTNLSERNGLVAVATGGVLLMWAIRMLPRRKGRGAVQMAIGAALIAVGFRQRQSGGEDGIDLAGSDERDDQENEVSADAQAELEPDAVEDDNPRDIAGESESEPKDGEGNEEFTDDQIDDPQPKPNLDAGGADDTRLGDDDDETADIDLSKASVAGDAGEAAGPTSHQSTSTEGTESGPTSTEDASHLQADQPAKDNSESDAGTDTDSDNEGTETEETESEDEEAETDDEGDKTA